jgi:hypothetical protein
MRPEREASRSQLTSAEVKNVWNFTYILSYWYICLITLKGKFIFVFTVWNVS